VNADDMVTGPDGRTYRVLGARYRNEGTRIVEVVELLAVDREPVARQTVADVLPALARIGASPGLLAWLRERSALSWQEAWDTCECGDQLAWLVMRLAGEYGSTAHRRVVGCLVEILYAIAWPCLHDQDEGAITGPVRQCLDGLARYADGEDVDDTTGLAHKAWCAAQTPTSGHVWRAASAVWYAAVTTEGADAAWFAQRAADAVRSGWVDFAAYSDALRCAAEIVRAHYPAAPEIGGAP